MLRGNAVFIQNLPLDEGSRRQRYPQVLYRCSLFQDEIAVQRDVTIIINTEVVAARCKRPKGEASEFIRLCKRLSGNTGSSQSYLGREKKLSRRSIEDVTSDRSTHD